MINRLTTVSYPSQFAHADRNESRLQSQPPLIHAFTTENEVSLRLIGRAAVPLPLLTDDLQ